jgi:GH15 family glucan-1,4-alpha-glucosidase
VLTWFVSHEEPPREVHAERALRDTEEYWNKWSQQCHEHGEWHGDVVRSLITLKGLTYAPTGGIVAAATTSLPEAIGGVRNWDYRYCWLRDATFTLFALVQAGYIGKYVVVATTQRERRSPNRSVPRRWMRAFS